MSRQAIGDARAAGGAGRADGQMHCAAQLNEMRLQGSCFMGACAVIVAQPWCITVCSPHACDRNDADALACTPEPMMKTRLVRRMSNFRRATTRMRVAYVQL